jgi:two-component system, LytTR family, sensor kinase
MSLSSQFSGRPDPQAPLRYLPAVIIVCFWVFQAVMSSISLVLMGEPGFGPFLVPRGIVACAGALISVVILKIHERQPGKPLAVRALTGLFAAVIASFVHAAVNFGVFQLFTGEENMRRATFESYLSAVTFWFWCYFALSSLLLALVYSRQLGERERDFAKLEQLAQAAQLKALRYQLNPHFMFNTLNSIASLICTGENASAERMVEGLGSFLRSTLSIDPQDDHPLSDEIELEKLYLGIEELRFPKRLAVHLDIDPSTRSALVPSLILQPLTENAVKHCVALSSRKTELSISSRAKADRLVIRVANSPPGNNGRHRTGAGVGLSNVAERLGARFGDAHRFQAGTLADGSFEVLIEIPLNLAPE